MTDKLDPRKIKILSITAPETSPYGMPNDPIMWAKVIFQIDKDGPEFRVVGRDQAADENIIRVARHYLHVQAAQLAEATDSWQLTDDELRQAAPEFRQSVPNTNPGSIPS
jgi:hypothetical protein